MQFKEFIYSEAWKLTDRSIRQFDSWAQIVKSDTRFMRLRPSDTKEWAKKDGVYDQIIDEFRREKNVPEDYPSDQLWQYAMYDYVYANQDLILAKVDPCKLLELRTLEVTQPTIVPTGDIESQGEQDFTQVDADPNLPLVFVTPAGVTAWDGNHRLYAACHNRMDAYAAIAFWQNYDAVKSAVKEVIKSTK